MADIVWVGSVVNTGTLTLTPGQKIFVRDLGTPGATLSGGGTVILGDDNSIDERVGALTNIDNVISGGSAASGTATIDVELFNASGGAVTAVGDGGTTPIELYITRFVTNDGFLSATQGGSLFLWGNTVDNTGGGKIRALDAGSRVVFQGTTVIGGTLSTDGAATFLVSDATFKGTVAAPLTIDGGVDVDSGHSLTLAGSIVGSPLINLETGASLLLTPSDPTEGVILQGAFVRMTTSTTIAGAGPGPAFLENIDGVIGAIDPGSDDNVIDAFLLNIGRSIVGTGSGLLTLDKVAANYAQMLAANTGRLQFDGNLFNSGEVGIANGGAVVFNGEVQGEAGQLWMQSGGGEADIFAAFQGTVSFDGSGGVVKLEPGSDFQGVWAGAAGSFDLLDVPPPRPRAPTPSATPRTPPGPAAC